MKLLPCELVQDLLPLYHDGVCSEASKKLVGSHLQECEACANALRELNTEIDMPKLEADAAGPIKKIKRKWQRKTWLLGLMIGIAVCFLWVWLTQTSSVAIAPEEYAVTNVVRFSNGMYYVEYQLPYDFSGMGANLLRTEDGCVYLEEFRPILARKDQDGGVIRGNIIDPQNHRTDIGTRMPMKAFYLGSPGREDNVLLWSAEEAYPNATAQQEKEHLYQHIFR